MCEHGNVEVLDVSEDLGLVYNAPGTPKRETVCIDNCIVDFIKKLWANNIRTWGCCCGHNEFEGNVIVWEDDIPKMKDMGYKQPKEYEDRPKIFTIPEAEKD